MKCEKCVTYEVQSTSAVALRDSVLLEFSYDDFRELATRYPRLNIWLARLMSMRLHGVIRQSPAEQLSTSILFIPANDGAPLEEFARQFSELLSRQATCLLISSAQTDTFPGVAGIAQAAEGSPEELRLRAWLDQQETRFRYMIYLADADVTNWTRRCIRQADEIISVGAADASPNLTEVELEILRKEKSRHVKPRKGLILLQPPGTARPEGTIRWLSSRHVDRHFHIRTGNQNDLDRVIRYVLRRETGLVLSGGGSRGFAHVAVDVVPPVDLDVHAPSLDSPSGWRIALNRINPFIKSIEIPGIVAILQRAGQLANLHNRRQRIDEDIADLYLRPPVEQFKILDFSAVDETVKIGYSYGVTEIDAWKKHG